MIIDYSQNKDSIDISYVDNNGRIDIETVFLENGYYKYVETDDLDPEAIPGLRSFKGSAIKKQPAKYFTGLNVNDFFSHHLKNDHPEIYSKTSSLNLPTPYSFDIETEITDEYGYSTPELAQNRILSISVTNPDLKTILFVLKNDNVPDFANPELDEVDRFEIDTVLKDAIGPYYNDDIKYAIKVFDKESDMLKAFIDYINKYFHVLIGWNCLYFDWIYIQNRCKNLGIDIRKASPVNTLANEKSSVNPALIIPVKVPKHRLILDYMSMFQGSLIYNNLESFALNNIADKILGLEKVSYTGNLRSLYNDNYNRFIAYALVDTILVMLIHKKTNLMGVHFFQSFYNEIPFLSLNQNPVSMALIYKELRNRGLFLLESEMHERYRRDYRGGYVKPPTKMEVKGMMGIDYNSLYPNSMISMFLSIENKLNDSIKTNELGRPINDFEMNKWLKYKSQGYCMTPLGRLYKRDENALFSFIEKKLLKERKIFKNVKEHIYLNIIPKIEEEIDKRVNNKL